MNSERNRAKTKRTILKKGRCNRKKTYINERIDSEKGIANRINEKKNEEEELEKGIHNKE